MLASGSWVGQDAAQGPLHGGARREQRDTFAHGPSVRGQVMRGGEQVQLHVGGRQSLAREAGQSPVELAAGGVEGALESPRKCQLPSRAAPVAAKRCHPSEVELTGLDLESEGQLGESGPGGMGHEQAGWSLRAQGEGEPARAARGVVVLETDAQGGGLVGDRQVEREVAHVLAMPGCLAGP